MTKSILLLGGSGYLGNAVANRFAGLSDYKLTVGDLAEPLAREHTFTKIDVLDKFSLNSHIKDYDLIINFTGQITFPINTCFNINTSGIQNIVEAVKSFDKKIIHISTVAVYGTCKYADETSPVNPESPYAACKAFAEYKIRNSLPEESFCILRLSNLYGGDQKKGLFAYLLKSYLSKDKIYFNNDGSLIRYFLHVNDCANAVFLTVKNNLHGLYNVAAEERHDLKEIISLIEKTCSIKFDSTFENIKPIENIEELNFKAFRNVSAFEPQMTLLEFITKTFSQYA